MYFNYTVKITNQSLEEIQWKVRTQRFRMIEDRIALTYIIKVVYTYNKILKVPVGKIILTVWYT